MTIYKHSLCEELYVITQDRFLRTTLSVRKTRVQNQIQGPIEQSIADYD